ncbi:MAG: sulfatase-like hydrolase/transferase [Lachnospiraceae bacterium]|nr:sulfatase-like hydrolase/transferase [Lachnospiraceae bacterium]
MKQIKYDIEERLNELDLKEAGRLIEEYKSQAPADMDLITYQCIYHLYLGNLDQALPYALWGVQQYPTNGDMYYNLASVYEQMGELLEACKNYIKALYIYEYINLEGIAELQITQKIDELWNLVEEKLADSRKSDSRSFEEAVRNYAEQYKTFFGLCEPAYRNAEVQIIGDYYWMSDKEKRYVGIYRNQVQESLENDVYDVVHTKGEFLKVKEGSSCLVEGDKREYLLPIAASEKNTSHIFIHQELGDVPVLQKADKHFNYYRVAGKTKVCSEKKSYYGKPIPLGIDTKKKKLVLNIFVDGLSQELLDGDGFRKHMPNTYEFFRKGSVCTQAYAAAEWTYPSIANYVTGLDTLHHMMFHNELDTALPADVPTLFEYFQEAGYYTAVMSGDWRIIPAYGYARGVDRFIYQHQNVGFKSEMMIGEVLDHLDAFQETNQFLWMTLGDLHDIADGLDLSLAVQNKLNIEERRKEVHGLTSAKQNYSENKIKTYRKSVSHMDLLLSVLYRYIEENYKEEEILISLFSDHGQAYMVPPGEHFMCKERARVAFMFRGAKEQVSHEMISASDYVSILCKLAGIPLKEGKTNGSLPVCFGGEQEREYALTESLHPKDPYYATYFAKNYTVFFENGAPTGDDGRFELKDYTITARDQAGKPLEDQQLIEQYLTIVKEHIAPLIIY